VIRAIITLRVRDDTDSVSPRSPAVEEMTAQIFGSTCDAVWTLPPEDAIEGMSRSLKMVSRMWSKLVVIKGPRATSELVDSGAPRSKSQRIVANVIVTALS